MLSSFKQLETMFICICLLSSLPIIAEENNLSLTDLYNIQIESVSKRTESLISAPSAVYVITSEEIKKYGITRIQDALRMVPGLVLVDKSYYLNEFNIREDLVEVPTTVSFQLDGVPIQNPIFGSVFTRGLEIPMEQIDRIEVIRGNGGTVYGANSVTGVVSIYTKKPSESQGFTVNASGGYPEQYRIATRYGNHLNIGQGSDWYIYGTVGRNRGYNADGNQFKGDSVWALGKNSTRTADSMYRISNKFKSNEADNPILWNGMASLQTNWTDVLSTLLHIYGRGMEDKVYAKKAYPYLTYQQAFMATAPAIVSQYVTNPEDLNAALNYIAVNDTSVFAQLLLTKGYATSVEEVRTIKGSINTQLSAAMTPLLSTQPADSVWLTDVHYRSVVANLRTDLKLSENHHIFSNCNVTWNDNKWNDYQFCLDDQNNTSVELELQDILNFQLNSNLNFEWITGGDLRWVKFAIGSSVPADAARFEKPNATEWLRSGFVQGKLTLLQQLDLIAGIKGEQWTLVNDDIQWMPSVRLAWKPLKDFTMWSSASRGATVPGYTETRMEAKSAPLPSYDPAGKLPSEALGKWVVITSGGNPPKAVDYKGFEGGLRWENKNIFVDFTSYYTLVTGRIVKSQTMLDHPIPSEFDSSETIIPLYFSNLQDATLWGIETMVHDRPFDWLTAELSYAYHRNRITSDLSDPKKVGISKMTPQHIIKARANIDFPWKISLSIMSEYLSSYNFLQTRYDFVHQQFDQTGVSPTSEEIKKLDYLVHLDMTITKLLFEDKMAFSVYGKNLAAITPHYEAYDYQGTHPEKTGPMYGMNVTWGF